MPLYILERRCKRTPECDTGTFGGFKLTTAAATSSTSTSTAAAIISRRRGRRRRESPVEVVSTVRTGCTATENRPRPGITICHAQVLQPLRCREVRTEVDACQCTLHRRTYEEVICRGRASTLQGKRAADALNLRCGEVQCRRVINTLRKVVEDGGTGEGLSPSVEHDGPIIVHKCPGSDVEPAPAYSHLVPGFGGRECPLQKHEIAIHIQAPRSGNTSRTVDLHSMEALPVADNGLRTRCREHHDAGPCVNRSAARSIPCTCNGNSTSGQRLKDAADLQVMQSQCACRLKPCPGPDVEFFPRLDGGTGKERPGQDVRDIRIERSIESMPGYEVCVCDWGRT